MLEAHDLSFSYGARTLYEGVNLAVAPGERVALAAPSGFGKTTLCQLLAGYLEPATGRVMIDGAPLSKRGVCPVQMVWQHPENAADPRMRMEKTLREAGECPQELLESLGIRKEWMRRYPHELSGGELQRFCIARALLARPRYLIADEISTMLDALTQAQIWHVILEEQRRQGFGLVFVSHSPALVERIATRVIDLTK